MGKTRKKRNHSKGWLVGSNATQIICGSFVLVIALGTLLLTLPIASRSGRLGVVDAMFTATSATCVTGLVVRDTWTQFTMFGQVVRWRPSGGWASETCGCWAKAFRPAAIRRRPRC